MEKRKTTLRKLPKVAKEKIGSDFISGELYWKEMEEENVGGEISTGIRVLADLPMRIQGIGHVRYDPRMKPENPEEEAFLLLEKRMKGNFKVVQGESLSYNGRKFTIVQEQDKTSSKKDPRAFQYQKSTPQRETHINYAPSTSRKREAKSLEDKVLVGRITKDINDPTYGDRYTDPCELDTRERVTKVLVSKASTCISKPKTRQGQYSMTSQERDLYMELDKSANNPFAKGTLRETYLTITPTEITAEFPNDIVKRKFIERHGRTLNQYAGGRKIVYKDSDLSIRDKGKIEI